MASRGTLTPFGHKVRNFCYEHDITQTFIADQLGVSRAAVSSAMRGLSGGRIEYKINRFMDEYDPAPERAAQ